MATRLIREHIGALAAPPTPAALSAAGQPTIDVTLGHSRGLHERLAGRSSDSGGPLGHEAGELRHLLPHRAGLRPARSPRHDRALLGEFPIVVASRHGILR